MSDSKPYKIVGFYDSETNNVENLIEGHKAFPILHQFGIIGHMPLRDITPDNVFDAVEIELYRHTYEVCAVFDSLPDMFPDVVPVIAVHNLGFDMYALSDWLGSHDVRVLAKSSTKPISFTILDESGEPSLVLWDTLQFSGKGLERMGNDCGIPKLLGYWDYDKQRTPDTELNSDELAYAKHDIYTLAAWLGFWCRNNPEMDESKLGLNLVTKTGIVRAKRVQLFDQVKAPGNKYNVGRFWHYHNMKEQPKTDDELFTMQACTRGGFTFCASANASRVFDLDNERYVYGYDATSMHPSQMVSHAYPYGFHKASAESLKFAAINIKYTPVDRILSNWYKPFTVAFNACFRFTNLRPKTDSLFAHHGIYPMAWARVSEQKTAVNDDNESQSQFIETISDMGYKDIATNPVHNFGKLVSADSCDLYLTELAFWELCQCYDFDSIESLHGYITNRFCKPTDMTILSVMHFYTAKRVFKDAAHEYASTGTISNPDELAKYAPIGLVREMVDGTASKNDVDLQMFNIKADLNALYGVECTNEYRDDTILTSSGIGYAGQIGIVNAPKNPKSWYQFGQRIVGWSRIMQNIAMQLIEPYSDTIICGDTDSVKFLAKSTDIDAIDSELEKISRALDYGKSVCCSRVRDSYPDIYDPLDGIGYYVREFAVSQFCAGWNKSYIIRDNGKYDFTIAGITTNKPFRYPNGSIFDNSYNAAASELEKRGYTFADVCSLLLGYNLLIDSSITKINGRKQPEWGSAIHGKYTDHTGRTSLVAECASLALFNMPKLIGGQDSAENRFNLEIAKRNNPDVNDRYRLVRWLPGDTLTIIDL